MRIEPYSSYGAPSPTSFATPLPPGSIENDRYQAECKKEQAKRYQDTCVSAAQPKAEEGILSATYNYLKSFFASGSSESVQGEGGVFQSIKSFFGFTPELTAPTASEVKLSKMHLENLSTILKKMCETIQSMQAAAKEEIKTDLQADEAAAFHAFMLLFKKYNEVKQLQKTIHNEEINFHFSIIQDNQKKQNEFKITLENAKYYSNVSDAIGYGAGVVLTITLGAEVIKCTGAFLDLMTAHPGLAVAAQLTSVAMMGLQGSSKLIGSKYNNERAENQSRIQKLQHESDTKRHENKDLNNKIKHLQDQQTNAITAVANHLQKYQEIVQQLLSQQ